MKEFKEKVKELEIVNERFQTDEMLLRYLRARQHNLEKSLEMFKNTLKFRIENDVENAIENFKKCKNYDTLMNYWPGRIIGADNEGKKKKKIFFFIYIFYPENK